MMRNILNNPFFQPPRDDNDASSFTPPIDIFSDPSAFTIHVALPGAHKSDIGLDWDPQRSSLRIAGVVHRPGDEAFVATLVSSERAVGVFDRHVPLPPRDAGAADADVVVDDAGITARMEHGILIVVVPKVAKEKVEVRRVVID
ncbi:HSP20-like chaperone [Ophiocordyceps camponoti-floridani]|uniref:HSP20-like chaperone n=1 Tax=Ophiocordyceps camponoti-floridani TaxID=2030778 RepID=A0A8H4VG73_9HYPO|nr:HSP20-like chaperone [Ophiocordyceps camponoti-floridani]